MMQMASSTFLPHMWLGKGLPRIMESPLAEQTHFPSKPKGATGLHWPGFGFGAYPSGMVRPWRDELVGRAGRWAFTTMA